MSRNAGKILKEGMIGGLIAYFSVVVVFALLNAFHGHSIFYTTAAMGTFLFYGGAAGGPVTVSAGPVLAYNGVHMLGSILVAVVAAIPIYESELHRSFWYFALMIWIAATIYTITVLGVFGVEIGRVLDWTTVVIGTAVWIASMTAYFWWAHRSLVRKMRNDVEAEA